jgi:enoyl-[acyl-carrier protein] reductase I
MGVANHRSIAWACVESLQRENFDVFLTCQNDRTLKAIETMLAKKNKSQHSTNTITAISCNVEADLPLLLEQQVPEILETKNVSSINAIVHSIAHANYEADNEDKDKNRDGGLSLSNASWEDFQHAQHISAFSLLETVKYAKPLLFNANHEHDNDNASSSSITALSYLGAVRAAPNYHLMGPAKASLEACVRGLAVELGTEYQCRVNAVSAGPLRTLSSRGIPQFTELYQHVQDKAPLKRNVSQQEVADTVAFLATNGTGITGQTIYVDAGYSSVIPI